MRSSHSIFKTGFFGNPKLIWAALACVALQLSVIVIEPLSKIFKTVPLSGEQWLVVALLSLVPLLVVELEKKIGIRASGKKDTAIDKRRTAHYTKSN